MIRWFIFAGLTLIILIISRNSLLHPHSHGFWRFFAWELILLLITFNIEFWFVDPGSWNQIISWSLLVLCLLPLIFGVQSLVTKGKPVKQRKGEEQLLAFEKTTTLVTTGIYRYIRHPLYSSLLLLNWGAFFKSPSWLGAGLALAASICLYFTAKADEVECNNFFGESYREYMQKTKRFVPFCF